MRRNTAHRRALPVRVHFLLLSAALAANLVAAPASADGRPTPAWQTWSAGLFARAQTENRFVLLDLEAVWCHWCHVMEETTYRDPKVTELLAKKYIPVRVDQDANPDLAARYGDWGWPATIVFAPDGSEIVKRRGYIPPEGMASLLQAIIGDPSPGPSVLMAAEAAPASSAFLTPQEEAELATRFDEAFDEENAGWGSLHRFIGTDFMDFALSAAGQGDTRRAIMARRTLDAAIRLIDREEGGIYQYSDKVDWSSPHYEKIMWYQAHGLRQYSHAFALWKAPAHLVAAHALYRYLTETLSSPEGAFYTSQDADVSQDVPGAAYYALSLEERRKLGRSPRIDSNIYARENGWAISGLVAYAAATGEAVPLERAKRAASWVLARRALADGGFRHGEADRGGPFLDDTLAMGTAFLDLYAAAAERAWLAHATAAAAFLAKTFRDPAGGFVSSASREAALGVFMRPVKSLEENVRLARFLNRLHRYTGAAAWRKAAEHALRHALALARGSERPQPGLLLAVGEFAREPVHLTIVAHKDDPAGMALFAAARAYPALYKRLEWWDRREGPLPNPDVTYPEMDRAAAFACAEHICSFPVFDAEGLTAAIHEISKPGLQRGRG